MAVGVSVGVLAGVPVGGGVRVAVAVGVAVGVGVRVAVAVGVSVGVGVISRGMSQKVKPSISSLPGKAPFGTITPFTGSTATTPR